MVKKSAVRQKIRPKGQNKISKKKKGQKTMEIFSRLNKMAFLACAGLVIGGCGFFGDLFGGVASNVNSTQGKFGEGQSVCNNVNVKESDMFRYRYDSFKEIGNLSGGLSAEQVEKALNAQIYYIDIKRNEKDNICGFVMTVDNSYNNITLTSQEIMQLEKALVDNDEYQSYEQRGKRDYYRALKFLKHIKRFKIPNDKEGLNSLYSLGRSLIYADEANENIKISRFLFGKKQSEDGYGIGFGIGQYGDTNLLDLQRSVQGSGECKVTDTSEDCSQQSELRAITNYAESLVNK